MQDFKNWLSLNDSKDFLMAESTISQFIKSNQEAQNLLKSYKLPQECDSLPP